MLGYVLNFWQDWLSIPNELVAYIANFFYSITNEIHLMPLMILACKISPKDIEGTVYAFIMGLINLGYLISYIGGGAMSHAMGLSDKNFDNLWIMVLI
jgi:hypothetical protein